jgi:hypothetical protein
MTTEKNGAVVRDIPVPPGGGSWRFDEAEWKWVSTELVQAVEASVAAPEPEFTNLHEEQ